MPSPGIISLVTPCCLFLICLSIYESPCLKYVIKIAYFSKSEILLKNATLFRGDYSTLEQIVV